jgi:hypothetical protein
VVFLQGCVFYPRTIPSAEEKCRTVSREWVLDSVQMGGFGSCSGRDCAYLLVAVGAVAAASAVVSGSVVLVGNTVYWLEKRGKCPPVPA